MARCTLETRSLSKRFGDRTVVDELSVAAQKGDHGWQKGQDRAYRSPCKRCACPVDAAAEAALMRNG